jgi:hypothetical protein
MTRNALNAAALAIMALVMASIALIVWAGTQRNATLGPAAITSGADQRLWLVADRKLFILDAAGALLSQASLAALGMDDSVAALAALPGGGAVAGSRKLGVLYVLDPAGRVERTIDPATTAVRHLRDGIALGVAGDRILVAHTGHHRLLLLDANGGIVGQAGSIDGEPGIFHFPNDIRVGPDGLVYVADTNHAQVEVLDGRLRRIRKVPVERIGRARFPVAVAVLPSGGLAVTVLDSSMRTGAAALLAEDGSLARALELQGGAEPLCLLARGSDLLVCDRGAARYHVRKFDHEGTFIGELGDAAFVAAMEDAAARNRQYATLRTAGQIGAIVAALLLLLVYHRSRSLEGAAREAALDLPKAVIVPWREQLKFQFAMTWPMLLVAALLLAVGRLGLPPGPALGAHLLLMVALVASVRWGLRNVQKPEFAAVIRAQGEGAARSRLKSLAWWGAREPLLAGSSATYRGRAVLVLVSPLRVAIVPVLGSEALEIIPIRSVSAILPSSPHWSARMIAGNAARGLTLQLLEPAARSVAVSFMFAAEHDRLAQSIQSARALGGGIDAATAMASTAPVSSHRRPAWSSFLLSALLPGLGHFNQRRNQEGALWVAAFGILALLNGLEWFVHVNRIAEVPKQAMLASSAMLAVHWLSAMASVWRHEHRLRPHAVRVDQPLR